MFHTFISDQQFTDEWIYSCWIPVMITIHQRNWSSHDDDTVSKSAQNSLPWVLPDKYIPDQLTVPLVLSLLALFFLFLPSTNKSLSEKCNVLFSLMSNNSPMNRFSTSNSTYVQISCVKYIPPLCWIWPTFKQKSSLFYQQSLGMIQTCVPNSQFSPFCRQSSVHSSANYIHCSVKLSVLISQFTVIHNSHPKELPICPIKLSGWALTFLLRVITWVRSDWVPM